MAFWRRDLDAVDGFDAAFTGWGREDSDIFVRMIRHGVRRCDGRLGATVLHLWHPDADRSRLTANPGQLDQLLAEAVRGAPPGRRTIECRQAPPINKTPIGLRLRGTSLAADAPRLRSPYRCRGRRRRRHFGHRVGVVTPARDEARARSSVLGANAALAGGCFADCSRCARAPGSRAGVMAGLTADSIHFPSAIRADGAVPTLVGGHWVDGFLVSRHCAVGPVVSLHHAAPAVAHQRYCVPFGSNHQGTVLASVFLALKCRRSLEERGAATR
jgi:hypothetical protein